MKAGFDRISSHSIGVSSPCKHELSHSLCHLSTIAGVVSGHPSLPLEEQEEEKDDDEEEQREPAAPTIDAVKDPRAAWRAEAARREEELRCAVESKRRADELREAAEGLERKKEELAGVRQRVKEDVAARKRAEEVLRQLGIGDAQGADHYAVLGVPRHAAEEEVARAYRALSRLCHPDKAPLDAEVRQRQERRMAALNEAYRVLCSKEGRWRYDRTLPSEAAEAAAAAAAGAEARLAPKAQATDCADDPADFDFDFSGDGRPFRAACGKAARVCFDAGSMRRERIRLAMAQLRGEEQMTFGFASEKDYLMEEGVVRHTGPYSPFRGLGESGDTDRLAQPGVRASFRDFLVGKVRELSEAVAFPFQRDSGSHSPPQPLQSPVIPCSPRQPPRKPPKPSQVDTSHVQNSPPPPQSESYSRPACWVRRGCATPPWAAASCSSTWSSWSGSGTRPGCAWSRPSGGREATATATRPRPSICECDPLCVLRFYGRLRSFRRGSCLLGLGVSSSSREVCLVDRRYRRPCADVKKAARACLRVSLYA